MVRALVLRGALAGAIGGLIAFVFALVLAEPVIDAAIGYEEGRGEAEEALAVAAGRPPSTGAEEELVSRGIQGTVGLGVGTVLLGVAMGLLVAVVYSSLHGRVALRPRVLALLVALGGFVTLYATPFLKYPGNPPAVGSDETIGTRSGLYLVMVVGSVVLAVAAVTVVRRLADRLGAWNATLVGIGVYVVAAGLLMALLPSLGELAANVAVNGPRATETPLPLLDPQGQIIFPGFDPDVLYDFRLYSFAAQTLLWGALGLVFGALAERLTGSRSRESVSSTSSSSASS